MEKHNYKITKKQLLDTFYEQNGNYTNTAKALQRKFGVPYTRQAVYKRIKKFPAEAKELWDLREDHSEGALLTFADDETNDIRLRVRIYLNVVNRLSKYKLYRFAPQPELPVQSYDPLASLSQYKAEPVDLSDRLMELAMRNKSLQEMPNN